MKRKLIFFYLIKMLLTLLAKQCCKMRPFWGIFNHCSNNFLLVSIKMIYPSFTIKRVVLSLVKMLIAHACILRKVGHLRWREDLGFFFSMQSIVHFFCARCWFAIMWGEPKKCSSVKLMARGRAFPTIRKATIQANFYYLKQVVRPKLHQKNSFIVF